MEVSKKLVKGFLLCPFCIKLHDKCLVYHITTVHIAYKTAEICTHIIRIRYADAIVVGYVMQSSPLAERVFKVKHTTEQTEDELSSIVGLGGTVVDVFVWHKVYGKIEATLNIFSPMHVKQFMEGVRTGQSTELMHITGGYHYHTVRADSEAVLDRIEAVLNEKKYIVPEI